LNNNLSDLIYRYDLQDTKGRKIEYTAGAPVIMDVATLRTVVSEHPTGWYVTESFRFLADRPTPPAIRAFVNENFEPQEIASVEDISVWHWGRRKADSADR